MRESKKATSSNVVLRSVGLGLVTGAADDDCLAIGTYAQAGAKLGYTALWLAPVTLPMMVAVVYLSGKLDLVTDQGLFAVLRGYSSRWLLYPILSGVIVGNIIEAAAGIGGMAASLGILLHLPAWNLILLIAALALLLQIWGSYKLIRNVLRLLALSLLAYVGSALLSHPKLAEEARGTFIPTLHFDRDTLAILVAIIGTSLSAYLYTWQSNEEVEEKIAAGKETPQQRRGATDAELRKSLWDVGFGMLFSNVVMYFIILATAATLYQAGQHTISSAMEAVPVMTMGAAYDLCQSMGWKMGCTISRARLRSSTQLLGYLP